MDNPTQLVKDPATGLFVEQLRVCPKCDRISRGTRCPDCDTAEHVPLVPFKDGKPPAEIGGSD